jgi:membrane protein
MKAGERSVKAAWSIIVETFGEWWNDNAMQLAAALAFYTVFSFAPILLIAIAVASMVFGREAVRAEILYETRNMIGVAGAEVIHSILDQARRQSSLATVIGVATSLFGATAVFVALQDALNTVWEVEVKAGKTVEMFFKKRLLSFLIVLGIGILLLASLIVSAVLAAVTSYLKESLPIPPYALELIQFGISFVVVTILFAVIYKTLPDVTISWADVWTGAAVTSLLFTIGKTFLGIYLVKTTLGSAYGAAGSLVLLLLWVYYSAQIFFLGAEFTQVYARRRGSPIRPDKNAVRFKRTIQDGPSRT